MAVAVSSESHLPGILAEQASLERQKCQYDAKHNSRTTLKVGDKVLLQEMKNKGRKGGEA